MLRNGFFWLLACLLTSSVLGQTTTTFTQPSGYTKRPLFVGFNPIGLSLHKAVVASGSITGESGATITDSAANFLTTLPSTATVTYLLEILEGNQAGAVAEIASVDSATQITLTGALAAGTSVTYAIRPAATLNETFGVDTAAQLQGSFSSNNADVVWVPDGNAGWIQYFYHSIQKEFREAAFPGAHPPKPIALFYPDGFFVQVKTTAKTLTFFGDVKTTPTIVAGNAGFNLVAVPSPVGQTLDESMLEGWLTGSFSSNAADVLWVPDGTGGYTQYFYRSTSGQWRAAAFPGGDNEGDTILPSSVLIQRKTASTAGVFDLPAFFSDL